MDTTTSGASCEPIVFPCTNGNYIYKADCLYYLECVTTNRLYKRQCSLGLGYNNVQKRCVLQANANCTCPHVDRETVTTTTLKLIDGITTPSIAQNADNTGVIVGAVLSLVIILMVLGILLWFYFHRKHQRQQSNSKDLKSTTKENSPTNAAMFDNPQYNDFSDMQRPVSYVQIDETKISSPKSESLNTDNLPANGRQGPLPEEPSKEPNTGNYYIKVIDDGEYNTINWKSKS